MAKRAHTKLFLPETYELVGGHIDFGESLVNGLRREIREELHMEVAIGDPFFIFTYLNEIKDSHSLEAVYFATFIGAIEAISLNAEDHSEADWFAADELEAAVSANKTSDDIEFAAMRKGFALLRGAQPTF